MLIVVIYMQVILDGGIGWKVLFLKYVHELIMSVDYINLWALDNRFNRTNLVLYFHVPLFYGQQLG